MKQVYFNYPYSRYDERVADSILIVCGKEFVLNCLMKKLLEQDELGFDD